MGRWRHEIKIDPHEDRGQIQPKEGLSLIQTRTEANRRGERLWEAQRFIEELQRAVQVLEERGEEEAKAHKEEIVRRENMLYEQYEHIQLLRRRLGATSKDHGCRRASDQKRGVGIRPGSRQDSVNRNHDQGETLYFNEYRDRAEIIERILHPETMGMTNQAETRTSS